MMQPESDIEEKAEQISEKISEIHKDLQLKNIFMVSGLKPIYGYFLTSIFNLTDSEKEQHQVKLKKMMSGFSILSNAENA